MTAADVRVVRVAPEATFALRQRVLRPHESLDEMALAGDDDPDTAFIAAVDPSGTAVSTARVAREPPPWDDAAATAWRLRAMATAETWRGQGLGGRVLQAVLDHVDDRGGGVVWCKARLPAVAFYERTGFVTRGEPWQELHIGPHIVMWREVRLATR